MSEFPEVDLTVLPQTYEQIIPESYLDEMGHVNVAWYSHLFSEGIKGLFGKMGAGVSIVKERAIGGFALESHIRYFKEVHLGDRIL
ncbi:MAG: acyl-CoA thioesterase, partial [Verrucomicrobia bacterium]|nr:acyl-CoA thioesterase [Verrucomicrobiota bacterium]